MAGVMESNAVGAVGGAGAGGGRGGRLMMEGVGVRYGDTAWRDNFFLFWYSAASSF